MNKKILSIFLLAFLLSGFAVPAYADSSEVNIDIPQTDPQVQAVNEAIDRIDLSAEDISEDTVIEALEAEGINARADKFAYVFDFAGLEAALADEDVNIILLLADIQMEYELTINRDISMSGVMGAVITSAPNAFTISTPSQWQYIYESGAFHFSINASDNIALVFSNVVLDGGSISGGIFIESSAHIKGALIQNCSNVYGAVTTADTYIETIGTRMSDDILTSLSANYNIALEDCIITDNRAEYCGGGIYSDKSAATAIKNCEISGNSAGHWGGGAYISSSAFIEISKINNNTANSGGGLSVGTVFISNSSISCNQASSNGGGMYLYGNAEIESTDITFNTAHFGGGIYSSSSSLSHRLIKGGTFESNTARNGGALYLRSYDLDANANIIRPGYVELSDMIMKNNRAEMNGGAVWAHADLLEYITINETSSSPATLRPKAAT